MVCRIAVAIPKASNELDMSSRLAKLKSSLNENSVHIFGEESINSPN
jgi:hypothetical protein